MKTPKVVFDSNVYVSAITYDGILRELLRLAIVQKWEVYGCKDIEKEVLSVLSVKFKFPYTRLQETLKQIRQTTIRVEPIKNITVIPNCHQDNLVLGCAIAAQVDYLVTGDKQHLLPLGNYHGVKVISPRELLDIVERIN